MNFALYIPPPTYPYKLANRAANTYRPCETEREPNRIDEVQLLIEGRQIHGILADDRCDDVAECARRRRINLGLVVLEADAEPRLARALAVVGERIDFAAAAQAVLVAAVVVFEVLEPEFEEAGPVDLWMNRKKKADIIEFVAKNGGKY